MCPDGREKYKHQIALSNVLHVITRTLTTIQPSMSIELKTEQRLAVVLE